MEDSVSSDLVFLNVVFITKCYTDTFWNWDMYGSEWTKDF